MRQLSNFALYSAIIDYAADKGCEYALPRTWEWEHPRHMATGLAVQAFAHIAGDATREQFAREVLRRQWPYAVTEETLGWHWLAANHLTGLFSDEDYAQFRAVWVRE